MNDPQNLIPEDELLVSIEEYNKELDEAEEQYNNGNYISHEDFVLKASKW